MSFKRPTSATRKPKPIPVEKTPSVQNLNKKPGSPLPVSKKTSPLSAGVGSQGSQRPGVPMGRVPSGSGGGLLHSTHSGTDLRHFVGSSTASNGPGTSVVSAQRPMSSGSLSVGTGALGKRSNSAGKVSPSAQSHLPQIPPRVTLEWSAGSGRMIVSEYSSNDKESVNQDKPSTGDEKTEDPSGMSGESAPKKPNPYRRMSSNQRACLRCILKCIIGTFERRRQVTGECGHT